MTFIKNKELIKKEVKESNNIWRPLDNVARAGADSITVTCSSNAEATARAYLLNRKLITFHNSEGDTFKDGYISAVSVSDAVITCTLMLFGGATVEVGDKGFKAAYHHSAEISAHVIYFDGALSADASNPQGRTIYCRDLSYGCIDYLALFKAAAGTGAACAVMPYKDDTALLDSAYDLEANQIGENINFNAEIDADSIFSMRITAAAGDTNGPEGLEASFVIVPKYIYESGHFEF